ncbi:MAG: guanine nucleotide-binding protein subunit alpha, partial [Gammaproteobacteria bacterium]|nr:guanine nucleotide-binding protein subunit alpha [Gammaproteobacteria bacterium]
MNNHTQRLREIRQACELGPLTNGGLDRYWIDTLEARDPLNDVRAVLRARLEDREDCKILFYGHGGSGKSTELNKLV